MSSDWPKVKLSDYCDKIGSGATPRGGSKVYLGEGKIALVRSQNVYNHGFEYDGLVYIDEKAAEKLSNVELEENDVLINITGDSVARVCMVPDDVLPARVNQHVSILRPKEDELDPYFLRYILLNHENQYKLLAIASAGGTRKAITKGHLEEFEIPLPDIAYQNEVSEILSTFDQKIHLNKQTNETLEAMAQAIFKSWFVDFDPVRAKIKAISAGRDPNRAAMAAITGISLDQAWDEVESALNRKLESMSDAQRTQLRQTAELFPDELVESEIGEVPKGWGYQQAQEIADIGIGKTPPRKEKHWFSESDKDVKWVSIKDMGTYGIYALDTSEYLTREAIEEKNVRVVPDNTVILSFKMTIGRTAITIGEMTTNEAIAHFKLGENPQLSSKYLFLYLSQFDFNALGSTSSIAKAINSKIIKKMPILVPQKEMVDSFTEVVEPIFRKLKSNSLEVETLSQLRDTLLPKLISGEIGI